MQVDRGDMSIISWGVGGTLGGVVTRGLVNGCMDEKVFLLVSG
jgi:hypothetical protein